MIDPRGTKKQAGGAPVSKSGIAMNVILLLWLVALTGYLILPKLTGKDIEARIQSLEEKSAKVVRKVNPDEKKQMMDIENRIGGLEKTLQEMKSAPAQQTDAAGASAAGAPTTADATSTTGCDCQDLAQRIAKLESLNPNKNEAPKDQAQQVTTPQATEKPSTAAKTDKPARKGKGKKRAAKAPTDKPIARRTEPARAPEYRGNTEHYSRSDRIYGGGDQTVFEMMDKYGQRDGYTTQEVETILQFSPGSGVYSGVSGYANQ